MAEQAVTLPLYSSRPRLRIDGQADTRLDAGLLTLSIVENEQGLFRLEMTFGNWAAPVAIWDFCISIGKCSTSAIA